jgi:hypothetical protein
MYKATQGAGAQGEPHDNGQNAGNAQSGETVTDAEFEEVK